MITITIKHLQAAGVKAPESWLEPIRKTCEEFHIDNEKRVAAFLAQTAHESGGYNQLIENLNYRASVLATCWPNRFAVKGANGKPAKDAKGVNQPNQKALALAGKPEQIANSVYSDRMGNGPESSGDGWKYRGRGLKQLTGKDNYERCGRALQVDLVNNPEKLLEPELAARSAGWFWESNNCSSFIDRDDFEGLTKRINGGLIGLADRQQRYQAVLSSFKE